MAFFGSILPPVAVELLAGGSLVAVAAASYAVYRMRTALAFGKKEQDQLEDVIEHLAEGFYRINRSGKLVFANPAFIKMLGFDNLDETKAAMEGDKADIYVEPGRRDDFLSLLQRDGIVSGLISEVRNHKSGKSIWVNENARLVRDPRTGEVLFHEGTVRETTGAVERIKSEERLLKLTQHLPGGLFQLERKRHGAFAVVFASQGFYDMLDGRFSPRSFDISHFVSLIHPEDMDGYNESLKLSRKTGHVWLHEFRVVTDAGKTKWFKVHATPEVTEEGSTIWHGYLQDVTLQKADQAQFRLLAYNDPLTKLPNRRFLADRLVQALAACGRRHEHSALLFLDLDNFKTLNDTYGHEAGDRLLVEVANRMRRLVRRNDTVARLAGDEFVVLLDGLSTDAAISAKKAAQVAQKALDTLRRPYDIGTRLEYQSTASIGVILFDETAHSADEILKRADLAMYEVKRAGRNGYKVFQPGREADSAHRVEISGGLAGATERGEFELRFQPQVNGVGKITGAEALLRWNHPKYGLLSPDAFMSAAEQNGTIAELNRFVIEEGVRVLRTWADAGAKLSLSINLGGEQLLRTDFARELRNLLRTSGIETGALVLEITEQMIGNCRADASRILAQLKTTGVRLSLDDFGAGFTSLASLKDLPVDEIKIDGRFVKAMATGKKDMAIVKTILALANALGLTAVAEHVETQAQEELLAAQGCIRFQGFLYGGALSLADFEQIAGVGERKTARLAG